MATIIGTTIAVLSYINKKPQSPQVAQTGTVTQSGDQNAVNTGSGMQNNFNNSPVTINQPQPEKKTPSVVNQPNIAVNAGGSSSVSNFGNINIGGS